MNPSTFRHGQPYTVTGSGFGSKATAAPLRFSDFENGTNGNSVGAPWTLFYHTYPPIYSNAHTRGVGTLASRHRMYTSDGSHFRCDLAFNAVDDFSLSGFDYLYMDVWYYLDMLGGNGCENYKLMRFHPSADGEPESYPSLQGSGAMTGYTIRYIGDGSNLYWNDSGYTDFTDLQGRTGAYLAGNWRHFQFIFKESALDTQDGRITWVLNCAAGQDMNPVITRGTTHGGLTNVKTHMFLGNYHASDGRHLADFEVFFDDVYIDNTWARVEIGDNATYASCTHREIQIPRAGEWSDTSVGFTVNRGSFAPSSTVYIFVVDSTNTVQSAGSATVGAD